MLTRQDVQQNRHLNYALKCGLFVTQSWSQKKFKKNRETFFFCFVYSLLLFSTFNGWNFVDGMMKDL